MYAEVGNLRAMFNKRFLCLTATANKKSTKKIMKFLQLRNYKIERLSSEKPNVKVLVHKLKNTTIFHEVINPTLEELDKNGHCQKNNHLLQQHSNMWKYLHAF